MIPLRLGESTHPGLKVLTPFGLGVTEVRPLSNLVLPSGHVLIGFPGETIVNQPSSAVPIVGPGSYPVVLSVAVNDSGARLFAALTVFFQDTSVVSWRSAGSFFTDSGDGCIVDQTLISQLRTYRSADPEGWFRTTYETLIDGDGSVQVAQNGANAIIWKTADWTFDAFVGVAANGEPVRLVVDGRNYRLRDLPWPERLRGVWRRVAVTPLTKRGRKKPSSSGAFRSPIGSWPKKRIAKRMMLRSNDLSPQSQPLLRRLAGYAIGCGR